MNKKIIYIIIAIIIILTFTIISVSILTADDTKYDVKISYDGEWAGEYNIGSLGAPQSFSGNGTDTIQIFRNSTDNVSVFVHSNDINSTNELRVSLMKNGRPITESFTYNASRGVELLI